MKPGMFRERETEFYVGVCANSFEPALGMPYKTLSACIDAMVKFRLGNLFVSGGDDLLKPVEPSVSWMIKDTSNPAVQAGIKCARQRIYFTFWHCLKVC